MAGGTLSDAIETPLAGIVREVRPGTSITVRAAGRGLRGIVALGGPTRGRLQGSRTSFAPAVSMSTRPGRS
jgi:antitoxin (DNA-binding transcriptional repressor) of toxin-antitoxin stability system